MSRLKCRVEEVLNSLSNKRVKQEKLLEFKKQVLSNKSLKEYFKNNPTEKEILQNDIKKHSYNDKILFRNLDTLPFYAVPKEIMATTAEQVAVCTSGSGLYVPDWLANQSTQLQMANDNQIKNKMGAGFKLVFVEPDEAQTSSVISSMIQFPIAAQRYNQTG